MKDNSLGTKIEKDLEKSPIIKEEDQKIKSYLTQVKIARSNYEELVRYTEEMRRKKEELSLITEYKVELITERVLEEGVYKYKQYHRHYQTQKNGKIYREEK